MCSKHVEALNKLIVKQKFCASSWLITKIKKKCKGYRIHQVRSGVPCFGVDIATVLVLLTTSTYNLHAAVIFENISVAQPAKKLRQLIDLLPCCRPLVLGSRL